MANYWGYGHFGQFYNYNNQNNNVNRYNAGLRSLCLRNYQGPFDRLMLGKASEELQTYIEQMQDTAVWNRIRRKTDINNYGMFGSSDGFGEASNVFSHAKLPESLHEQDVDEENGAFMLQGNSNETSKQFAAATVTYETAEVEDLERSDIGNRKNEGADLLLEENPDGEYRKNRLESNCFDVVQNEVDNKVYLIEEASSDNSQTENIFDTDLSDSNDKGEQSGSNKEMEQTQKRSSSTFKCDLCNFVSDSRADVQQHLNKAIHFAASEYILDNAGKMKLKNPMVLRLFKAKYKTVLVVCPNPSCLKVFPDIHVCAEHYSLWHLNDNRRNLYGLIDVVKEEVCDNVIDPLRCNVCNKQYDCRSHLNNHFRDSGHYPQSKLEDCQNILFCTYCKVSFDTFENITSHQDQAHRKSAINGSLQFTVFHYKSVDCHTLLDGQASTNSDLSTVGFTSSIGTSKRKFEGNTTEMEPKKKIAVNNENAIRTSEENLNYIDHPNDIKGTEGLKQYDSTLPGTLCATSQNNVDYKNESTLEEMFKCDYCMKVTKNENQMYLHLVEDVHSSASTFLTDHEGNIVYLKQIKTVTFEGGYFKKIAALCPESNCRLLFDTVYMCDDHNIRCHHGKGGYYHLVDIVDRIPNKVSVSKNICSVCKLEFEKGKQLNAHYSQSNHFPFTDRSGCNVYILCCYCNKTFTSYTMATEHVKIHQAMAKNGMLDMVILYVGKLSRKCTIPPYQPNKQGEVTSIQTKVNNLKQMKKSCGNSGRAELTKEIRELKNLL